MNNHQLNTILYSEYISTGIKKIQVFQPDIAKNAKAGQFVIVRLYENGERIPLTIVEAEPDNDRITLIVQEVGKSTRALNQLKQGELIRDILGPLGTPTEIEHYGLCIVIGGGVAQPWRTRWQKN